MVEMKNLPNIMRLILPKIISSCMTSYCMKLVKTNLLSFWRGILIKSANIQVLLKNLQMKSRPILINSFKILI